MNELEEFPAFKSHIWDDPTFCNNCYSRVRQVIKVDKDAYRETLRPSLSDSVHYRTESGVIMYGVEQMEGEEMGMYRAITSCENCGSVGCVSIPDTVSKRTLLRQLDKIVEWLERKDLDPDEDLMRSTVHELKSEEDSQGKDPLILAEAVERGI